MVAPESDLISLWKELYGRRAKFGAHHQKIMYMCLHTCVTGWQRCENQREVWVYIWIHCGAILLLFGKVAEAVRGVFRLVVFRTGIAPKWGLVITEIIDSAVYHSPLSYWEIDNFWLDDYSYKLTANTLCLSITRPWNLLHNKQMSFSPYAIFLSHSWPGMLCQTLVHFFCSCWSQWHMLMSAFGWLWQLGFKS